MHQQPPHTPLCFSTSRAKSGQVPSSRGLVWKLVKIRSFNKGMHTIRRSETSHLGCAWLGSFGIGHSPEMFFVFPYSRRQTPEHSAKGPNHMALIAKSRIGRYIRRWQVRFT
jgi:hypothetical protein